jgi:hypothetical protein
VSTDENGAAEIHDLPAGQYWLAASYRGIEAGRELIEVNPDAKKPKRRFDFQWADYAYSMRTISGRLTGLVKGNTHPGVLIELRNAFSDEGYRAVSDGDGMFTIDPLVPGTYILTIGGGEKSLGGQTADPTTIVVDLTASAKRRFLPLRLQDGGCGGAEYELKTER